MDSPRFKVRGKALQTLAHIRLSPAAGRRIIQELEHGEFTTAYLAAEIIGEHGLQDGIPALRKSLHSTDVYLQGKSMVALARLGDEVSYPAIESIFNTTKNPRLVVHGAQALVLMGGKQRMPMLLTKINTVDMPVQVRQEVLYGTCEIMNCENEFYQVLKALQIDFEMALDRMQKILTQGNHSLSDAFPAAAETERAWIAQAISSLQLYLNSTPSDMATMVRNVLARYNPACFSCDTVCALFLIIWRDAEKGRAK